MARRYYERLGKTENCQVAVSLSIANEHGSLPLGYQLYLPQEWAQDPKRRAKAGPASLEFQTKTAIALQQIDQAIAAGYRAASFSPMRPMAPRLIGAINCALGASSTCSGCEARPRYGGGPTRPRRCRVSPRSPAGRAPDRFAMPRTPRSRSSSWREASRLDSSDASAGAKAPPGRSPRASAHCGSMRRTTANPMTSNGC